MVASFTESVVEDAALTWLGALDYTVYRSLRETFDTLVATVTRCG